MPQSLARVHVHLVFSTKGRRRMLSDRIRPELHALMIDALRLQGCIDVHLNSVEDHVHILFDLPRSTTLSDIVKAVKTSSSRWIKTWGPEFSDFAWQGGYAAFSVSESAMTTVKRYVARQQEHHRYRPFKTEFRQLLTRHKVPYDERFAWD